MLKLCVSVSSSSAGGSVSCGYLRGMDASEGSQLLLISAGGRKEKKNQKKKSYITPTPSTRLASIAVDIIGYHLHPKWRPSKHLSIVMYPGQDGRSKPKRKYECNVPESSVTNVSVVITPGRKQSKPTKETRRSWSGRRKTGIETKRRKKMPQSLTPVDETSTVRVFCQWFLYFHFLS